MGVLARSRTWGHSEKSAALLASAVDDQSAFVPPSGKTAKLQRIVEVDDREEDAFDSLRYASGNGGWSDHVHLVRTLRQQQAIIHALQRQNEALERARAIREENESSRRDLDRHVHVALQLSYSKLHAMASVVGAGLGHDCRGEARDLHKIFDAVENVLEYVREARRRGGADLEDATRFGTRAQLESTQSCARLLSPSSPRFGFKAKTNPLSKVGRFFSRCFTGAAGAPVLVEEDKIEKQLILIRSLLSDLRANDGAAGSRPECFEGTPASDAGAIVEASAGDRREILAGLNTVHALARKSEAYTERVVKNLLKTCGELGNHLEDQEAASAHLAQSVNQLNLKLLSSENKSCQIAMEMLLAGLK